MTPKTVQRDHQSIDYLIAGQGEPVVLVHGFAEDGRVWEGLRTALENEYTVIIPDLPGSGRSTGISAETNMESLAEALKTVLDNENISRCAIVGHSMGGYVALAFVSRYPAMVSRFGLFHSTSRPDSEEKKAGRKKTMDFIRRNGVVKYLEQSVPGLFSPETNENNPGLIRDFIERYSNFSPDALVHYTAAMMNRPERTEILRNFPGPVLFIIGEYDTAIPMEQSLKECHLPGISYIYVCTHSAHSGMLEEPEFCISAVRYFLSGK